MSNSRYDFTFFTSAARTATATSTDITAPDDRVKGLYTVLDITAATNASSGTLSVKLQRLDHISKNWVDLPGAVYANKTGTGTSELIVYPGVGEAANVAVSDHPSHNVRAVGTVAGATTISLTYSFSGRWLR